MAKNRITANRQACQIRILNEKFWSNEPYVTWNVCRMC